MLGEALASILRSRLGQYLDTQDLEVSVAFGKDIVLKNVKLRESVFRDAGVPLRCVYGKVQELSISIPWTNIYSKPTKIKIEGLYMLMVPSSSVPYNQAAEEEAEHEAKMAKILAIEEAKQRGRLIDTSKDEAGGDTFVQKLMANIFKNLQVSVKNVHIRIEDNRTNRGYPFGAGVTLDSLDVSTDMTKFSDLAEKSRSFHKVVDISSLALYWQPHEKVLYSELSSGSTEDRERDLQFAQRIARASENGGVVKGMKYLLGPVSIGAEMAWCPEPKKINFQQPFIDLNIKMQELKLKITKYQYQDFAMLLHSFNSLILAARYRKYKVKNGLEGVPNYSGRWKQVWQFAIQAVLEEEVRPQLQSWSFSHMMEHTRLCREYRELYKAKLLASNKKLSAAQLAEQNRRLDELEHRLDTFNIGINRERAEAAADARRKVEAKNQGGGYFSWIWGGGKKTEDTTDMGASSDLKQLDQALTQEEKQRLFEAIGYQEEAEEGVLEYPKRFVKYQLNFLLEGLTVRLVDEDLQQRPNSSEATILTLKLESVGVHLRQRPAAANLVFELSMETLTVTGIEMGDKQAPAQIITTICSKDEFQGRLLNLEYEANPPADSYGDLDADKGSIYDRRVFIHSSPLEIIYDMKTVNHVMDVFRPPDEVQIAYLQETAIENVRDRVKEVRMTKLGLEFVIANHKFVDVNIRFESSYVVVPLRGVYTGPGCPCLVANLGSVAVRSGLVTQSMVDSKKRRGAGGSGFDALKRLQDNLLDQAYDKFTISLEHMEVMLALAGEDWRADLYRADSPLHLLRPISLELTFKYCLITNDPDFPITQLTGRLPCLGLSVEERRLLMLAEILETILDPEEEDRHVGGKQALRRSDSNSSFSSAVSSLTGSTTGSTSSYIGWKRNRAVPDGAVPELPKTKSSSTEAAAVSLAPNVVQMEMTFTVDKLALEIERDTVPIFKFEILDTGANIQLKASGTLRGGFAIGGCRCEHLKFKTPSGGPVPLLCTTAAAAGSGLPSEHEEKNKLLSVTYLKARPNTPDWTGVQQSITAALSSVDICLHQDALLDLASEATMWLTHMQARAAKLMAPAADKDVPEENRQSSGADSPVGLKRAGARRLSRQTSGEPATTNNAGGANSLMMSIYKPKGRRPSSMTRRGGHLTSEADEGKRLKKVAEEVINFQLSAKLHEVTIGMMTAAANFSRLTTQNLAAEITLTPSGTQISAQLKEFKVYDVSARLDFEGGTGAPTPPAASTRYPMIVESTDAEVFDLAIQLNEGVSERDHDRGVPDVHVRLKMGQIRLVFLMKYVKDLLVFIDPFTNLKEYVAERTRAAYDTTAKMAAEVVYNSNHRAVVGDENEQPTRVKLDITLCAPVVLLPIHSESSMMFEANLGRLELRNNHHTVYNYARAVLLDTMSLEFCDIALFRCVAESPTTAGGRRQSAKHVIIQPISFELEVSRNMSGGAVRDTDLPDIAVHGTLHEVAATLRKEDYDQLITLLTQNFAEEGVLSSGKTTTPAHRTAASAPTKPASKPKETKSRMSLPIKPQQRGSSPASRSSHTAAPAQMVEKAGPLSQQAVERSPMAKTTDFQFTFKQFSLELLSDSYDAAEGEMEEQEQKHYHHNSLAKISIDNFNLKGDVTVSGAIKMRAGLENVVLEDTRFAAAARSDQRRIVRLLEAKTTSSPQKALDDTATGSGMIGLKYERDAVTAEIIEIDVNSFVVVASVAYLLRISDFFVPKEVIDYEGIMSGLGGTGGDVDVKDSTRPSTPTPSSSQQPPVRKILFRMAEPDIILVNDIDDLNTDAIMINAELALNLFQKPEKLSMQLILDNLRGHTCRFDPAVRDSTLAQILRPTNMAMHFNQDLDVMNPRTRIDMNFNSLVMNVSPASIMIILQSYNTFMENFQQSQLDLEGGGGGAGANGAAEKRRLEVNGDDSLWKTTDVKDEEFWFLKVDEGVEAYQSETMSLASTISNLGDEQLMFKVNQLIITVESGHGNNTTPLLLLESKIKGEVRNWSSRLSVTATTELEAAYYNSQVALWEPVLEPTARTNSNGRSQLQRWTLEVKYIVNSKYELGSALLSPNYDPEDETDGFISAETLPPMTEIKIASTQTMQLTITRSFLGVLHNLSEAFGSLAGLEKTAASGRHIVQDPLIVVNSCGRDLVLTLGVCKNFILSQDVDEGTVDKAQVSACQVLIPTGTEKALRLKLNKNFQAQSNKDSRTSTYVSPLVLQTEESEAMLRLQIEGEKLFDIPISKTDQRFFPFAFRGSEAGYEHGIVSHVVVENLRKILTIKSLVTFKNYYPDAAVRIYQEVDGRFIQLALLVKGDEWNAPLSAVYSASGGQFYLSLDGSGQNMGLEHISWKDIEPAGHCRKVIECTNTRGEPSVYLNVEGCATDIFRETSRELTSRNYVISIRPLVVLKNCLPVPLFYACGGDHDRRPPLRPLQEGESGCLEEMRHGQTLIRLRLTAGANGTDATLACNKVFDENMKQLEVWRFESADAVASALRLDLGVQKEVAKGTTVLTVFAPFWFVNKTGRTLSFRGHDNSQELVHSPEDADHPLMFSYITKSLFGKKKVSMRVDDCTLWSDPFTVDTIGDMGKVACKLEPEKRASLKRNELALASSNSSKKNHHKKDDAYHVGIQISQSAASLTKIVTFTPYIMAFNAAEFGIELKELEAAEEEEEGTERSSTTWLLVPSRECVPLWPLYGGRSYVCRVAGSTETTVPFSVLDPNPSLLMLPGHKYGGIDVRTKLDTAQVLVTLAGYRPGAAPVLLINHTATWQLEVGELGSASKRFLAPGKKCLYTWERPSEGSRTLVWSIKGIDRPPVENTLKTDGYGSFTIGHHNFSWVSFLDGMQRVLFFTHNACLADRLARTTGESERIEQEVEVSIHGIGLSLVNNAESVRRELAYLSISSSDIVWEVRKEGKQRYKALTMNQCRAIEADYAQYHRLLAVGQSPDPRRQIEGAGATIVLHYLDERMEAPVRGRLRRQFQKGLWLQLRSSPHQQQIHLKVNRVQLDNQLAECLYPVIAAPVPPPKSVMAESVPKPFLELSVLEYTSPEHTDIKQYKYVHALVQELQLKVELGFINALVELFEEEEILEENTVERMRADLLLAAKPLRDHATAAVSLGRKDFYDYLHLSPLKIHVSFSLTSYHARRDGAATRSSNFIVLLLQSFGVTVTDSNDIIFRLAYFERKHQFYGMADLLAEMSRHYTSQAVKQMYVVLLGLDVIGNPFGLAVGVARSVEDLFYEPFQGAVEGPSEFAEGLAIGVRSVFSGVVGGAAGTVSRITGALGKGLASLTFDEKFQKKRRETIKRREQRDLVSGMAVNVRDLSMGFVGGITGLVTKPVEGATQEGALGFFKGVGKGVAGLVTRPTGGIVDFASGTFDTVKRATEVSEDLQRVRPARFIHPDGVVRYYDRKEAEGVRILSMLDKGRYAAEDTYMMHEYTYQDREVFLITNNRVMYLSYNSVLGSWSLDWEYEYGSIQGPPSVQQEDDRWYIIIQPKEEKKSMLGGLFAKSTGKKIFLPEGTSKEGAQLQARVIEDLRTGQNNFESVFINMILKKAKMAGD